MSQSPFKFLDSYTREDHDIYFGRTNETEALYTAVFKSKMVLLYGVSGTGKSSLIQCGLANKFQESDWLPVFVRRGRDMLDSLFQSLIQTHIEAPRQPKKRTAKSFLKLLQSLYLDHFKPVYLIFDQFEELFIFGNKEERNEFVQLMEALQQSDVQVKVIFSIREEYLAMLTEFEDRLPELFQNRIRVERMHFPQAKEVIQGACQYAKIEIEEGFEEQLLEKLTGGKKELELTYLQVLLDRLWKKSEEGKNGFTLTLLESMGHISDLLGQFLEEQINELEEPEQGLTVLKTFVSVQGTKKQLTFEEIHQGCLSLGKDVKESGIQDLLQRFTDLRILRDKDESGRYELRHDSLAAKIYEKITLAEKELMEVRQFVEQAYQLYEKKGIILSKDSLDYIAPYRQRMFLKQKIRDFVDASRHYYVRKAKRRRRILTWSISTALLIAIVSGIFIWRDLQATREAARIATAHNLANQAMDLLQDDPKQAFKTAVDAYNMEPDFLSKKAVMNAYYQGPYPRYELNTSMKEVDFTLDGRYIIMSSKHNVGSKIEIFSFKTADTLCVFNKKGSKLIEPIYNSGGLEVPVIYDTTKQLFISAYEDSTLVLWTAIGDIIKEINTQSRIVSYWLQNECVFLALENSILQYNLSGNFINGQECDFNINHVAATDSSIVIISFNKNKREGFALFNSELDNEIKEVFLPKKDGDWNLIKYISGYWMTDVSDKSPFLLISGNNASYGQYLFLWDIEKKMIKEVSDLRWGMFHSIWKLNQSTFCIPSYSKGWTWELVEIKNGALKQVNDIIPQSIEWCYKINDSLLVVTGKAGSSFLFDFKNTKMINQYKNLVFQDFTSTGNRYFLWFKGFDKNQLLVLNKEGDTALSLSNEFLGASWSLFKISDKELLLSKPESNKIFFVSSETFLFQLWKKENEKKISIQSLSKVNSNYGKYIIQNSTKGGKSIRIYSLADFTHWDFAKLVEYPEINLTVHYGGTDMHDDRYVLALDSSKSRIIVFDYLLLKEKITIGLEDTISSLYDFSVIDSVLVLITDRGLFAYNIENGSNYLSDQDIMKYYKIKSGYSDSCFFYIYSSYYDPVIYCYNHEFERFGKCDVPASVKKGAYTFSKHSNNSCDKLALITRDSQSVYLFNEETLNFDFACDISIYPKRDTTWFLMPSASVSGDSLFSVAILDSVKLYGFFGKLHYSFQTAFEYVDECDIKYHGNQQVLISKVGYKSLKNIRYMLTQFEGVEVVIPSKRYQESQWTGSMDYQCNNNLIESDGLYFDIYLNQLLDLSGYQNFMSFSLCMDSLGFSNQFLVKDYKRLYSQNLIHFKYSSKPYLLKLPVTVPRMFEILQESGLDTTYGFDNIPKNF